MDINVHFKLQVVATCCYKETWTESTYGSFNYIRGSVAVPAISGTATFFKE
jgi:hypothetical protein